MVAVRHGKTNKLWAMGRMWLWRNVEELKAAWAIAQECELVKGELSEHKIVTIDLVER